MDGRTWPNEEHYRLLADGTLEQLHNMYAFLPSVETYDQEYFMRLLREKIEQMSA
jgi:hypothetical protein